MYVTKGDLKEFLGISNNNDDNLLDSLIDKAQTRINAYTNKVFESATATSHYFTFGRDTDGRTLYFDNYLASADDLVVTNGDGTVVASNQFVFLPSNQFPAIAIKLKTNATVAWTYNDTVEDCISVEGHWSYTESPPDDIVLATLRYSAYLYRQKDSQVFDQTSTNELGTITIKSGMPNDVKEILDRYVDLIQWSNN